MTKKLLSSEHVNKQWTLFLDRDGVINRRPPNDYVKTVEEFVFLPGAVDAIARLSKLFGRIIVITNQQGVGLGLMSDADLEAIHRFMLSSIEHSGGKIDAVYSCKMLKTADDNCRKPLPSMGLQAKADFPELLFEKAVMAGDTESDMLFGAGLGMYTVKIGFEPFSFLPNHNFESLSDFASYLIPDPT